MSSLLSYQRYHALMVAISSCVNQELLPSLKGKVMLDLGTGSGIGLKVLGEHGACVIGVDTFPVYARGPEQLFGPTTYAGVVRADIRDLPIRLESIDGVASFLSPVFINKKFKHGLMTTAKSLRPGVFVVGSSYMREEIIDLEKTLVQCGVQGGIRVNRHAVIDPVMGVAPDAWMYIGKKI